jgi:hypothetical protein
MRIRTRGAMKLTLISLSLSAFAVPASAKASPTATTLAVTSDGIRVSSVVSRCTGDATHLGSISPTVPLPGSGPH